MPFPQRANRLKARPSEVHMAMPAAVECSPPHSTNPSSMSTPRLCTHRGQEAERAVADLVCAARAGDDQAWEQLHERFSPMLRGIARSYRLSQSDVDDVLQNSWLRLLHHIDRIREPAAVAGWLATTTRRECLRLLQVPLREAPTADLELGEHSEAANPERELLAAERRVVLGRALATLPDRHRRLMTHLVADSDADYVQVGAALAMPVGSIGPTRARSLARLRRHPELRSFCLADR